MAGGQYSACSLIPSEGYAADDPRPNLPTWADTLLEILSKQIAENEALHAQLRQSIDEINEIKTQLAKIPSQMIALFFLFCLVFTIWCFWYFGTPSQPSSLSQSVPSVPPPPTVKTPHPGTPVLLY